MEWFYNLSNTARTIIILVGVAIIAVILWFAIFGQDAIEEEVGDSPDVSVPIQEPSTGEPGEEGEPSEEETTEPAAIDTMETIETGTELSNEEVSEALTVAKDGITEWFHVDSRESQEDRMDRVSDYVEEGSPMWDKPPVDEDAFAPSDTESTTYALATVGSVEPIGGTEEDFRALISATVQMELTLGSGEDLFAQQFSENHYFHVALRKTDGEWKLYNYED